MHHRCRTSFSNAFADIMTKQIWFHSKFRIGLKIGDGVEQRARRKRLRCSVAQIVQQRHVIRLKPVRVPIPDGIEERIGCKVPYGANTEKMR